MEDLFPYLSEEESADIRRRFPAVPAKFSGTIEVAGLDPEHLTAPGMPRPRFEEVPIPATSRVTETTLNIIASDPDDWRKVLHERLCDLCKEPLAEEERMFLLAELDPDDPAWLLVRGGLHRRCFRATAHWCVHIRERLLAGTMCGASIPYAATLNPEVFTVLDGESSAVTAAANVIAEYRISRASVNPEWPYRQTSAGA